jgi:hypothetical protein
VNEAGGFEAWRERLMPWVMAAVRLGAGWLLTRATLLALLTPGSVLRESSGAPARALVLVLLGLGLPAFAWPRTCLAGAALLAAGVGAAAWLWHQAGLAPRPLATALAVIGVLACGEWLTRRVQRRLDRQ